MRVKIAVKHRVEAVRHAQKTFAEPGLPQADLRPRAVNIRSGRHILPEGESEQAEVLKHNGEQRLILRIVIFSDINAVEQDLALRRVIEPAQQLDERRLTAAVAADDGQLFADAELHAHMAQRIGLRVGIAKGHIAEFHLIAIVIALFHTERALIHGVWDIEVVEIALHVFLVRDGNPNRARQPGDARQQQHDGRDIPRDGADGQAAPQRRRDQEQIDTELERIRHKIGEESHPRNTEIHGSLPPAEVFVKVPLLLQQCGPHTVQANILAGGIIAGVIIQLFAADVVVHTSGKELAAQSAVPAAGQNADHGRQHDARQQRQFCPGGEQAGPEQGECQQDGGSDLHRIADKAARRHGIVIHIIACLRLHLNPFPEQGRLAVLDQGIGQIHGLFRMLPVNQPVQLGLADVRMHFQQGACQPDKGRQADGERSIQGKRLSTRTGRQGIDDLSRKIDRDIGRDRSRQAGKQGTEEVLPIQMTQQPDRAAVQVPTFFHACFPP